MSAERFRKKPVVIEAWQATGIREMGRIVKWIESRGGSAVYRAPVNFGPAIDILTLEGTMEASLDDWVIRGVQGEFYPVKPDIFAATYGRAVRMPESAGAPTTETAPAKSPKDELVRSETDRARLQRELDEAREMYARSSDRMTVEILEREEAEARVAQLEAALEYTLANMPGHSHWREGGAGGRCEACERYSRVAERIREVLAADRGAE